MRERLLVPTCKIHEEEIFFFLKKKKAVGKRKSTAEISNLITLISKSSVPQFAQFAVKKPQS